MITSRLKKRAGPTSIAAAIDHLAARLLGRGAFQAFVRVSIMTIAASTIAPIAMAMPPRP